MFKQNMWFYVVLVFSLPFLFFTFLEPSNPKVHSEPAKPVIIDPIDNIYNKFDKLTTDLLDYIWPTNASHRITSSFAEFRNTHFHGGIDISTNKRTGYDVYAARDGYVWHIQILPNGYGKMLYIKHRDGYVTTYAHLKTFNDEINTILKQEQLRKGTFAIDLTLDSNKIPVKKGDVVAYTGDTGAGPAHLHFEIRDENLNYVNPLLFENFRDGDGASPIIKKISISPLEKDSYVNHESTPYFYRNPRRSLRSGQLPKPVEISGQIGLEVETIDISNVAANRSGVYSIQLSLDDSVTYHVKFDRLPNDDLKQILLHYDLPSIYSGAGKFQKLFVEEGTTLPIYGKLPYGSGIINTEHLNDGIHNFKILVKDFSGNESEFNGRLLINNKSEILLNNHPKKHISETSHSYLIPSDRAGSFTIIGTPITVSYDSAAVFKPIDLTFDSSQEHGTTVYSFGPQDVLLNKGITISIESTTDNHTGIYTKVTGDWRFQTSTFDADGKYLSVKFIRTLGEVAVFEDNQSPTISRLKIQIRNQKPFIIFKYHDSLSGFNDDKFKMFIDNELVIPEFEWENNRVLYQSDEKFEKGKHSIKIVIADKMNNTNEFNSSFRVR
jgi:hypothetical protein